MLNTVPSTINQLARQVVINHPNAYNCEVYRKTILRTSDSMSGGLPTMGGLGVLSSDDEEDFEYTFVGNGFCLQVEGFQPSMMMDRQDANNNSEDELRFLIEPETMNGMPGWFDVRKNDVLYIVIGEVVKLGFEVVGIETTVNIPPFTNRYICNRRDDLHII